MKSHALPGIFGTMAPVLNHYGLLAVAVLVFAEDFGVPVPGETVLIAAAVYAGAGKLSIVGVGIIAFVAAVAGDNVGFAIGWFGGRALALRFGRYVFLTGERLDKAEAFLNRHGGKVIVVARFIEGLRQANGIVAGIGRMRWLRFFVFNALGAALWVAVWVTVGYFGGSHIEAIYGQFERYVVYVIIAAVVAVAALILWHLRKRWHGRGQARDVEGQSHDDRGQAQDEHAQARDGHGQAQDEKATAQASSADREPSAAGPRQDDRAAGVSPGPAGGPRPGTGTPADDRGQGGLAPGEDQHAAFRPPGPADLGPRARSPGEHDQAATGEPGAEDPGPGTRPPDGDHAAGPTWPRERDHSSGRPDKS